MKLAAGRWQQLLAAIGASLTQGTIGLVIPLSSLMVPQLMTEEDGLLITEDQGSWFASFYAVGSLTGCVTGSYLCDRIGRRRSMMLDSLGFLISFLIMGFADSFELLLLARWLGSHCSGSSLVSAPIFISETSHPSIRGSTGSLMTTLFVMEFAICMLLGAVLHWRKVVFVSVVSPIITIVILFFLPESPTWLLLRKQDGAALKSMLFYRQDDDVARLEVERIEKNIRQIEKEAEAKGSSIVGRMRNLASRMMDRAFWKPFLLLNLMLNIGFEWAGFPALAFYMHSFLKKLNTPFDEYWIAFFVQLYRMFMTMIFSCIMGKASYRFMYLGSGSLVAAALILQASYATFNVFLTEEWQQLTSWVPLAAIFLQYTGYGLGYGSINFILQGEILPSDMRSFGAGLLGFLDNFSLFAAIKTVPILTSSLGIGGTFYLYASVVLGNLLICYFAMPETRGLSLEDIEDLYRNEKVKHCTEEPHQPKQPPPTA